MKWLNKLSRYSNYTKCSSGLSKSNSFLGQWVSRSSINDKVENKFVSDLGFFSSTPLKHNDPGIQKRGFRWWCYQDIPSSDLAASSCISSRSFGQTPRNESPLTREWLAKLWVEKSSGENTKRKRQRRALYVEQHATYFNENHSFFRLSFDGLKKKLFHHIQPAISQSDQEYLEPTSSKEAKVAHLLTRSNLLITRDIEWANLMWGFEQENRYAIVDACYPQSPVGYIREQSNIIFRQFLRTRRPFIAYITDAMGNELFRVRRPFWWINSTIFAEIAGKEIGVVHRRWHLWRRVYDLYLGDKQFAVVENPGFWNWTFTLKDEENNVLAEIDRNWRGVGFELFTDAGQYVIRFGLTDPGYKTAPAESVQELETVRPLTLSERAVAVALAISLDNDYFSRHGGWGMPFIAVGGE